MWSPPRRERAGTEAWGEPPGTAMRTTTPKLYRWPPYEGPIAIRK
jgi:hypothetical protein